MALGYIPQLFSPVFPNSDVVYELMSKSGAKVMIYDEIFAEKVQKFGLPTFLVYDMNSLNTDATVQSDGLCALTTTKALGTDTAVIVHSSGTTSGMPKLIPVTHNWLTSFIIHKWEDVLCQGEYTTQNIINSLGSLAHVGSFTCRS
jgi:non-ribosomal peptide synthetase component E (peptide arylation enzyme)